MRTAHALKPAAAASPNPVRSAVILPASLPLPQDPAEEARARQRTGLPALPRSRSADLVEDRGALRPGVGLAGPARVHLGVGLPAVGGEGAGGRPQEVAPRRSEPRRFAHVVEPAGDPLLVLELDLAETEPVFRLVRREPHGFAEELDRGEEVLLL